MMKRSKKTISQSATFSKPLLLLGTGLIVVQVFLANSLSVQGKEISHLEGSKSDLDGEISQLKEQSSTLSSLDSIRAEAVQKLSMIDGLESFDYLGSSVALR